MLGFATAIDAVGLAAAVDVLHEWAVVAHDQYNRVLGDAKLVNLVEDFTDPAVDLCNRFGDWAAVQRLFVVR
jgi:hypothetical protein